MGDSIRDYYSIAGPEDVGFVDMNPVSWGMAAAKGVFEKAQGELGNVQAKASEEAVDKTKAKLAEANAEVKEARAEVRKTRKRLKAERLRNRDATLLGTLKRYQTPIAIGAGLVATVALIRR